MRPSLLALCCSLLAAILFAAPSAWAEEPRWGKVYTVSGNVAVRESPSDTATKVRVLKPGQKVRVDFQDDAWGAVFDPNEKVRSELKALGYVRMSELRGIPTGVAQTQTSSIEMRKPAPDAKPEVLVDGRPVKGAASARTGDKASDKASGKTPGKAPAKDAGQGQSVSAKPAKPAAKGPHGFGEIRVPDRSLTIRAARDKDSEFRRLLKPGQRVLVDFQEDGWYAVFDPEVKTRDIAKAWGFGRDKYLVPESAFAGVPPEAVSNVPSERMDAQPAPARSEPKQPAAPSPKQSAPQQQPAAPAKAQKADKADADPDVGYSVISRKENKKKPPTATLRVRLDLAQPPAPEALRKIVREIWKAERKKDENLQIEVLLNGMDAGGLAYAMARFHDDGRVREFWWRDVVLGKPHN